MSYPFEKCSALLPMMGAQNGTDFPDFSPAPRTFTAYGGAKTVTDAASPYGSRALFESNGYLRAPHDAAWMFPDGTDFTIEATVEFASVAVNQWIATRWGNGAVGTNAWLFYFAPGAGQLVFHFRDSNGSTYRSTGAAWSPSVGVTYKVQVARQGTTYYFLADGVVLGSTVLAAGIRQVTLALDVGALMVGTPAYSNGLRMHDLRITTAEALHTEAYTPPARLMAPITGVVRDANGDPVDRTIIAVHRQAPLRTFGPVESDIITGAYELWVPAPEEYSRVVFAADAGSPGPGDPVLPDLIDRILVA